MKEITRKAALAKTAALFDEAIDLLVTIQTRYKPGGLKKHCWLCLGDDQHKVGCFYPLVESLLAKAQALKEVKE